MNRIVTADRIHDGERFLAPGTALELSGDGRIHAVLAPGAHSGAEHFEGVLCPGFVNAHCHLELSHMLGAIPEGTGLIPFLQGVMRSRGDIPDERKREARHAAFGEMIDAGIVAVGDIANTTDTLDLRASSKMQVHTFVECMGFVEATAPARLAASVQTYEAFREQASGLPGLGQSIVPHAPYSVSGALFRLISAFEPGSLISIHNQETPDEDAYYRDKTGKVRDLLGGLGIDDAAFPAHGCSSLQAYLPWLDESHPLLLVHNTCSTEADIRLAQARVIEPYWCLCPGANLYIEGRIPDLAILASFSDRICIGTDSLASNHKLSVIHELRLIAARYPGIGAERLLRWACSGGADALRLDESCGRFRQGMAPGVLHLPSGLDAETLRRIA